MTIFFAKNLKFILKNREISQKDFARELGIKTSTFNAYTRGKSVPSAELEYAICQKLDVDLNTMLFVDIANAGLPSNARLLGQRAFGYEYGREASGIPNLIENLRYLIATENSNAEDFVHRMALDSDFFFNLKENTIRVLIPLLQICIHFDTTLDVLLYSDLKAESEAGLSKRALAVFNARNKTEHEILAGATSEPEQKTEKVSVESEALRRENELLRQMLEDKNAQLADKDARIADKDEMIALLRKR